MAVKSTRKANCIGYKKDCGDKKSVTRDGNCFLQTHAKFVEWSNIKRIRRKSNRGEAVKIAMFGHKRVPSREGGIEIVVEELSTRMVRDGHEVVCYNRRGHHVSGAQYDNAAQATYKGVRLKTVPTWEKRGLAAVTSSFFAAACCAVGNYDVVHIHAEGPAFFAWLPKLFGKRVIVTIHGWKDIIWLNQKTPRKYSVLTA